MFFNLIWKFKLEHLLKLLFFLQNIAVIKDDGKSIKTSTTANSKVLNASKSNTELIKFTSNNLDDNVGTENAGRNDHNEDEDDTDDDLLDIDDPNRDEAQKLLESLVKASYLKSLSSYEILNFRKKCSNWLQLQQAGESKHVRY